MTKNGTVSYSTKTGGGFLNGNPVPVSTVWSDPIDCLFTVLAEKNRRIVFDDNSKVAFYEILIEMQPFESDRIRLTNNRGKVLGEFQVQNVQFLDLVGRVKIIV
jgi:hypothetical protein